MAKCNFFCLNPCCNFQAPTSKTPRHVEHKCFVLGLQLLVLKVGGRMQRNLLNQTIKLPSLELSSSKTCQMQFSYIQPTSFGTESCKPSKKKKLPCPQMELPSLDPSSEASRHVERNFFYA
jgi:hypothetical protein